MCSCDTMEDDSLMRSECPDCQLQILQHQQGQSSDASNPQPNASAQYSDEERRLSQVNVDLSSSHIQSQAGVPEVQFSQGDVYQASHSVGGSQSRTVSSSHCQNVFGSYSKDLAFHQNALSSHSIPVSSSMPSEVITGTVPSVTLPVSSNGCYEGTQSGLATNATSTTAGEQCENYYCSTCSAYDIPNPTNEKFFRTNSSRPPTHVFPPIFYAQGPSSVIPCFSPIPDCTPWGNEYASYAYASASYSQSASAVGTTDYYGYSVPTTGGNTGNYETMTSASNYVPSASYSSIPASYCTTTSLLANELPSTTVSTAAVHPSAAEVEAASTGVETSKKHSDNNTTGDDQESVSIEISSTSSLDDSFNSLDDSEIDESSTLSDDRELISVVEDDEEQTGNNYVHEAAHSVLESHLNQCDSSQKCLLCLGSMSTLPECTSPQLAKILEHIDGDISTEDLDISVSSVDIEIGGIEDEMKAFTSLRKKSHVKYDMTFARLSQLLDTDKLKARNYKGNSGDNVPLCCRCHKLACLVDSYQKQMTSLLLVLNQLMSDDAILANSKSSNCSNLTTDDKDIEKNVNKKSIETQTDEIEEIRCICSKTVGLSTSLAMATNANQSEEVLCPPEVNVPTTTSTYANSVNELVSTDCSLTIHTQEFQVDEGSDIQIHNSNNSPESDFVQRTDYQDNEISEPPNDHLKVLLNSRENPSQLFESIPKKNTHECEFCKRKFTTRSYLRSHTEICKFKLTQEKHQDDRILRDSTGMRCSKCGIGFRNVLRWTKHSEQGCQSTIYQCSECPQRFTRNSELKVHVKVHMKDKSYKCDVCNVAFTTKGNLIAHSRTHSSSKKFECRFCHKGFNRRFALTMHENRHKGLKLFRCNLCSKDFADPSNLNSHRKRSHVPFTIQ